MSGRHPLASMARVAAVTTIPVLAVACAAPAGPRSEAPTTLRALYGAKPLESFDGRKTALVLVDFQEELFRGRVRIEGGEAAVREARRLLDWARSHQLPIVHVRNVVPRTDSPIFAQGSPLLAFVPELAPRSDELVVTKPMAGAFSRTDLDSLLRERGVDTLVVAGIMTHLAIDTTAREGTVLGYRVVVAQDACTSRPLPSAVDDGVIDAATVHRVTLASLADRFAEIASVADITSRRAVR